jgi:hypothetical protein
MPMSTDLYGIRVMALDPRRRRVRLRVFVTYYDADEYDQALLDGDPSFFLRVLWDEADTRPEDGAPLRERVSLDEILDEDWVDGNTWRFVARYEVVASKNVPFTRTDIAGLPARSYDLHWFTGEESLVQTDYDVWVTDPRWLAHLSLGRNWTTSSYPTQARPPPSPPTWAYDMDAGAMRRIRCGREDGRPCTGGAGC